MLTAILAIVAAVVLLAGVAYVFFSGAAGVSTALDFCREVFTICQEFIPSWLVPFAVLALALAVFGIIIKLV